jgi:pimeloyl-ACP methyl ester carboxylesterase
MPELSPEQFARVNDEIELCYQTVGDPSDPTILLIMGLGTQMQAWYDDFCIGLAQRGYHVVRFDNRDIGRSTQLDGAPVPTRREIITRRIRNPAYRLSDMARDATGLLDHLEIEKAHVVGASMGGMIAQTMAIESPERMRSLTSLMSNPGSLFNGQPSLRAMMMLTQPPAVERELYIERVTKLFRIVGSTGFERSEDELREFLAASFDRGHSQTGPSRQLAAVIASGSRVRRLRQVRVPTLVIHGTADRLIRPSGGRATARAIPGARLMLIRGMGHDLPRGAWRRIQDGIVSIAQRAEQPVAQLAA